MKIGSDFFLKDEAINFKKQAIKRVLTEVNYANYEANVLLI